MMLSALSLPLLALSDVVLAVTIRGYAQTGCKGASIACSNISTNKCCNTSRFNGNKGAYSARFSGLRKVSHGYGWQTTRDGKVCGSRRSSRAGDGCINSEPKNWGTYAGLSWVAGPRAKRDEAGVEFEHVQCTGSQEPDVLMLEDGTEIALEGMAEEHLKHLTELAVNGSGYEDLQNHFSAFVM